MQVDQLQGDVRRRRRRVARHVATAPAPVSAQTAAPVDPRRLPQGAAKTYRTFPVTNVSKAGGEWTVDWERAHADAQKVLDAIDFSKRDIVIWVPGTSNHGPHPQFEAAVRDSYRGDGSNLVALEYEATWHLRRSVPTGIATLRLVLEGIRARGGDHRVLLGGESQGAWIIGEVVADTAVSSVVDRAVLLGHPWLATHHYDRGQDPRVRVINHEGDQVAMPVNGDPTVGLDAMLAIRTLDVSKGGALLKGILANPRHAVELLKGIVYSAPVLNKFLRHPHNYSGDMSRAVEFLRHGTLPVSDEYAKLMHVRAAPTQLADPAHDEDAHLRLARGAAIAAYQQLRSA